MCTTNIAKYSKLKKNICNKYKIYRQRGTMMWRIHMPKARRRSTENYRNNHMLYEIMLGGHEKIV